MVDAMVVGLFGVLVIGLIMAPKRFWRWVLDRDTGFWE